MSWHHVERFGYTLAVREGRKNSDTGILGYKNRLGSRWLLGPRQLDVFAFTVLRMNLAEMSSRTELLSAVFLSVFRSTALCFTFQRYTYPDISSRREGA